MNSGAPPTHNKADYIEKVIVWICNSPSGCVMKLPLGRHRHMARQLTWTA